MKILIINSVYGFSSTGRICATISKEAQKRGDTCMIACREARVDKDDLSEIRIISSPIQTRFHGLESRLLDDHGLGSRLSTKKFLKIADEFNPDLLWIHNIHGYYLNYEMLFSWIKSRPNMAVKWTLHDCWAFTGHCAYFSLINCEKWKTKCNHCELLNEYPKSLFRDYSTCNYIRKKEAFCGVSNLSIITPSKWLASLVKDSFLSEYPVEVIYNTIDTDSFKHTQSNIKKELCIENKHILLGVANIWGYRKGLDRFIELSKLLPNEYIIVLVGEMSEKQKRSLPSNIIFYGKTDNKTELAGIYSAADYFLCLTREDNYPTVLLEAESCGTPVITLDVGGCKEAVKRNDSRVVSSLDEVISVVLGVA